MSCRRRVEPFGIVQHMHLRCVELFADLERIRRHDPIDWPVARMAHNLLRWTLSRSLFQCVRHMDPACCPPSYRASLRYTPSRRCVGRRDWAYCHPLYPGPSDCFSPRVRVARRNWACCRCPCLDPSHPQRMWAPKKTPPCSQHAHLNLSLISRLAIAPHPRKLADERPGLNLPCLHELAEVFECFIVIPAVCDKTLFGHLHIQACLEGES